MSLLVSLFLRKKLVTLTFAEKVVLHTIADRIGKNKCAWIDQVDLISECELTKSGYDTIQRSLKKKKLILIKKVPGKRGKRNEYYLHKYVFDVIGITANTYSEEGENDGIGITTNTNRYYSKVSTNVPDDVQPIESKEENSDFSEIDYINNIKNNNTKANNTLSETVADAPESEPPPPSDPCRFEEVFSIYPGQKDHKTCQKIWRQKKLNGRVGEILADIADRKVRDAYWQNPRYVKSLEKYLRQEGWTQAIVEDKENEHSSATGKQITRRGASTGSYMQKLADMRKRADNKPH